MDFYAYQEAAYVSIDGSSDSLDFSMNQYYCTIDWDPVPFPMFHGYVQDYWEWVGTIHTWPKQNGWYYHGDPGSPGFHYQSSCPVTIPPPPHPANPPSNP